MATEELLRSWREDLGVELFAKILDRVRSALEWVDPLSVSLYDVRMSGVDLFTIISEPGENIGKEGRIDLGNDWVDSLSTLDL